MCCSLALLSGYCTWLCCLVFLRAFSNTVFFFGKWFHEFMACRALLSGFYSHRVQGFLELSLQGGEPVELFVEFTQSIQFFGFCTVCIARAHLVFVLYRNLCNAFLRVVSPTKKRGERM